MSHGRAVALMVATTLMWSISGVVTRHLDSARGFEVAFWRSAFTALALLLMLGWLRGPRALWRSLRGSGHRVGSSLVRHPLSLPGVWYLRQTSRSTASGGGHGPVE